MMVGWTGELMEGGQLDGWIRVWGGTSGTRKVFTNFLLKTSPFVQSFSGGCLPVRR